MSATPTFREALRFWLKLGCISFGGPAGQIAIMHTELVDRKRWIDEERFLHALNFCMLLPGPEATQLATYCGWRLHGIRGGLTAGGLFVLPSALLLWLLSWLYAVHGNAPLVAAVFSGLKPAVTAIVAAAVIRIGRRALRGPLSWGLAAGAFAAIFFLQVAFPVVVLTALAVGFLAGPRLFRLNPTNPTAPTDRSDRAPATSALKIALIGAVLWFAPVLLAGLLQGWSGTLAQEGVFFSKAAMVTFGGAYAVLPYVGQQAVDHFGWLSAPQMLDGLGLAETTPGPLIMVVQFVGFVGAWNHPGGMSPLLAGTLGAAITTWTTFVPCFLWIFLGAPHLEWLRSVRQLNTALAAVTAAVVGVVLNLAVWFGLHSFLPAAGGVDWFAVAVAAAAFAAMQWKKVGIVPVVIGAGLIGLIVGLF
jgi:chromate transporter